MKFNMSYNQLDNQLPGIRNKMKIYEQLGISKEKLTYATETLVIDSLINELNNNTMFHLPPDLTKERITKKVDSLGDLGFNKAKILKVLEANGFNN